MRTVVLGAGRMGHGLGLSYALGGHDVTLVDRDAAALQRAQERIREAAAFLVGNGLVAEDLAGRAVARIGMSDDMTVPCGAADLVQEAIPEELRQKQDLLAAIEALVPGDAIIATNTSSLRIGALATDMRRPERLVGMHWVAPPYLVPIVEVVRGDATEDGIVRRAVRILEDAGKIPVVVADVPGFAVNRLQYALFAEAVDLVDQGVVGPEGVDLIVRYAMAPRQLAFGQFRLFDLVVSGRTVLNVANYLYEETGDGRFRPSPRLAQMVAAGRLGLASGAGWYEYDGEPADIERQRDEAFALAYRALAELDRQME
jgi:3-hydroxyacyl-CoA dehydrogenase